MRHSISGDMSIARTDACQDAVLHRLDLAMQAFFRRLGRGERPGFPRFKSDARWNQLEYPHGDRAIKLDTTQQRIRLPGVGSVKLRKGRDVPLNYGRVFLARKNERWYAVFECKREIEPMERTGSVVGIDAGITAIIATSDGELIENPRHANRHRANVERAAIALDAATEKDARGRCLNRRDPKRKAKAFQLARCKEREANGRRDFLHKVAIGLVRTHDAIAVEALKLRNMTRSAKGTIEAPGVHVAAKTGLNRAMLDTGIGMLRQLIVQKAEWAARAIVVVDPKYTSQTCFACKHRAAASRERARFVCVACGYEEHADINAALNILDKAELRPRSVLAPGDTRLMRHDAA
ncbi:MAG: RNA-guided endonuclease InsQ/TnpB family protein [Vulcanimicrobiaceae bacterium]